MKIYINMARSLSPLFPLGLSTSQRESVSYGFFSFNNLSLSALLGWWYGMVKKSTVSFLIKSQCFGGPVSGTVTVLDTTLLYSFLFSLALSSLPCCVPLRVILHIDNSRLTSRLSVARKICMT